MVTSVAMASGPRDPQRHTALQRVVRRLRYGRPVIVVSGLPRSGTSLAMRMLAAGGVSLIVDGVRSADASNPAGYYEFERVKQLPNGDYAWLPAARGRAVKVISYLLPWLPETFDYRLILMHRHIGEVMASQRAMLQQRGENTADDARDVSGFLEHLEQIDLLLARRPCFEILRIDYAAVIANARTEAERMQMFLQRRLNVGDMVSSVDRRLYRTRLAQSGRPA